MFCPADQLILVDVPTMRTLDLTVPAAFGLPDGQIVKVFLKNGGYVEEVDPVLRECTGRPQEFKVVNT